jgi:hypothetical protein
MVLTSTINSIVTGNNWYSYGWFRPDRFLKPVRCDRKIDCCFGKLVYLGKYVKMEEVNNILRVVLCYLYLTGFKNRSGLGFKQK